MLSNYYYQYFKSVNSIQLRKELNQPQLKKPDAYKSINSSSVAGHLPDRIVILKK